MQSSDPSSLEAYPAPPECVPPAPRRVVLAFNGRLIRGGLLAAFLGLPNLILSFGYAWNEPLRELTAAGQSVSGSVLDRRIESRGRSGLVYYVRYQYAVDGREYTREDAVPPDEYRTSPPGAGCLAFYLPGRPGTCCLGRPGPLLRDASDKVLCLAGVAAVVLAGFLVWYEFQMRRERALARDGEPMLGQITYRGTTRNQNVTRYWARYRFTDADGAERTSWNYVPNYIWDNLSRGAPVTVLVDPASSGRHLPLYAFRYVTIVERESAS